MDTTVFIEVRSFDKGIENDPDKAGSQEDEWISD
jgi:hypothetical protein